MINKDETEGYDLTSMQMFRYLNQTQNKYFSTLWFSAQERTSLQTPEHDLLRLSHMKALNVPVQEIPLQKLIQEKGEEKNWKVPGNAHKAFKNYLEKEDILYLEELRNEISPLTLMYVIDPQDQHLYLIILNKKHVKAVLQLWPKIPNLQETTKK